MIPYHGIHKSKMSVKKTSPSAGWWSMAQLAAQDYFARLQASGLSPFQHPELAGFPGMGMGGNVSGSSSGTGRQGASEGKSSTKGRKEKKSNNSNNSMGGGSSGGASTAASSAGTSSAYKV